MSITPDSIISTGWAGLDAVTGGFKPGDFWFVYSRPSVGKTVFALNMAAISTTLV